MVPVLSHCFSLFFPRDSVSFLFQYFSHHFFPANLSLSWPSEYRWLAFPPSLPTSRPPSLSLPLPLCLPPGLSAGGERLRAPLWSARWRSLYSTFRPFHFQLKKKRSGHEAFMYIYFFPLEGWKVRAVYLPRPSPFSFPLLFFSPSLHTHT